ncbi:hypothetical protein HDU96_000969 [Phlyctochytrium bullatum]|nr:hypothetical protein HDU96_000969 [Phlyctochytrium bullatum]
MDRKEELQRSKGGGWVYIENVVEKINATLTPAKPDPPQHAKVARDRSFIAALERHGDEEPDAETQCSERILDEHQLGVGREHGHHDGEGDRDDHEGCDGVGATGAFEREQGYEGGRDGGDGQGGAFGPPTDAYGDGVDDEGEDDVDEDEVEDGAVELIFLFGGGGFRGGLLGRFNGVGAAPVVVGGGDGDGDHGAWWGCEV